MSYIDGFVLPIPRGQVETYKQVSIKVAEIWKEYGALSYQEFIGDDLKLEGTRSFAELSNKLKDEVIVFGWVIFDSKTTRDLANKAVPQDSRMADIVAPLVDPDNLIFDASRMMYGGFKSLSQ